MRTRSHWSEAELKHSPLLPLSFPGTTKRSKLCWNWNVREICILIIYWIKIFSSFLSTADNDFWLWGLLCHFIPFNTYFQREKIQMLQCSQTWSGYIKNYGSGLKLREKYKVLWIRNNGGIEAAIGQCQLCQFPFQIVLIFLTDKIMLELILALGA